MNARLLLSIFIIAGMTLAASDAVFGQDEQTPNSANRIPKEQVASAPIAAIGDNSAIYFDAAVPRSIDHALMQVNSKAHYFHEQIKGRFTSSRIRQWQTKQSGVPCWSAFDNASF